MSAETVTTTPVSPSGLDHGTRDHGPISRSWSVRSAFWIFVAVELGAFVLWFSLGRTEWFTGDEWEFLADRTAFDLHDLLREHFTHWTTVPILVYRLLWWLFGIDSYAPYLTVLIVLHLTAAALLRVVMRRAGVNAWIATAAASAFALFGSGYQNIVWAFQIGFVAALVLGLVHLLLADHDGPVDRRDFIGIAAGFGAIMSTGVGVPLVGVVALAVLVRRGWRPALLHSLPIGAVYVLWWAIYSRGNEHPGVQTSGVTPADVADFTKTGVQRVFGSLGQFTGVGAVLATVFLAGLVLAWQRNDIAALRQRAAAPAALAVGGVAFLVFSGTGRVGLLGTEFSEAPRYQHIVAASLLPAIAVALDAIARRWRMMMPLLCALLLVGVPGNVDALADYTHNRETPNRNYRNMILAIPGLAAAKEVPRNVRPDASHPAARKITVGWLLDGAASGRVPVRRGIASTEEARIRFRLSFVQRPGDESDASNCTQVGTGLTRRLDRGDSIFFMGVGAMKVTPGPTTVPGNVTLFFSPANGQRLVAVLETVDVVLQQRNPYAALTVCDIDR